MSRLWSGLRGGHRGRSRTYPVETLFDFRSPWVRDAGALLTGTVVSGLFAYAYVVIGTQTYGASAFAPISVLWTIWAMSSAAITFPTQHWVIRTVAADGNEGRIRAALPLLVGAAVLLSALVGVGTWLARSALFSSDDLLFPLLAAAIPFGSVAVGLSRGLLAARRRFVAAAAAFAGENVLRVIAAVVVVLAGWGPGAFALALQIGFLIVAVWPSALRPSGPAPVPAQTKALTLLSALAGGTLISQVVLTGGPLMLAALGGAPISVTGLFSTLALFRAPYILATGLAVRLTGWLTRVVARGSGRAVRRLMWSTLLSVAVLAPLGALFGAVFGPGLVGFVFGSDVSLTGDLTGVVAAGSTVALGCLVSTLVLVAADRGGAVTASWAGSFVVGVGWAVLGPGDPLVSVTWAFLIAEIVSLVTMTLVGGLVWFDRRSRETTMGSLDSTLS